MAAEGRIVGTRPSIVLTSSMSPGSLNAHILDAVREAFTAFDPLVACRTLSPREVLEQESLGDATVLLYLGSSITEAVPLGTLAAIARMSGAVSVYWATDDPYEFDARHRAEAFYVYYSNDRGAALYHLERPDCRYLPLAAPRADRRGLSPLTARRLPVFFCGYPYSNRRLVIEDLLQRTDLSREALVVAGPDWDIPGLHTVAGLIGHEQLINIYADSAFVLDLGRSDSLANQHFRLVATTPGPRTFECALAGTPQINLASSVEIDRFFVPGAEVICAEDVEEVAALERWYRARPEAWAQIAAAAQERVLQSHLYEHRIARLLADLVQDGVFQVAKKEIASLTKMGAFPGVSAGRGVG